MNKSIFIFLLLIVVTTSVLSQTYNTIDENAALQLPAGWKSDAASISPTLVHLSESQDGNAALTILKELPADLEVDTLGDYTSLKIELLRDSYPDFHPTALKMGEVNGLRAAFFDSSATVETPDGTKLKVKFVLMTVKGKDHFYFLIGLMQEGASSGARNELVKVYTSFKEKG